MKVNRIQSFLATINGIEFTNERRFDVVEYILHLIEYEFRIEVTTPNENTKTTDLYKITKENDYLTFSAKKPYNHLYKTKTMEITYANSGEYVIVTDHQAYKIPKESVSE